MGHVVFWRFGAAQAPSACRGKRPGPALGPRLASSARRQGKHGARARNTRVQQPSPPQEAPAQWAGPRGRPWRVFRSRGSLVGASWCRSRQRIRVYFLSRMFGGHGDIEAYDDDLYREESSSELSVDSEVEFHLYSQVHYAQSLGEGNGQEENEEVVDSAEKTEGQSSVLINTLDQGKNRIFSDNDVVQISDGPEIIILSDTPDEESVYKSKVKKTAIFLTPAKQYSQLGCSTRNPARASAPTTLDSDGKSSSKGKRANEKSKTTSAGRVRMIQEILVIEDSSNEEEEEESTISESDNVESWMLLGCDADVRDENIILNLEGCGTAVSEGEDGVDWSISDKDLEKIPPCCLCAERDHLQNNCPARFCLNCCLPGHCSRECLERAYWRKHCNRCDMKGHYADACPEIWRQYHLTTRPGSIKKSSSYSEHSALVYCYNCSQKGHYGYECSEKRMYNGAFPSSPFIYYYDDEYDIKRRAQRAKRKVEELQEAGLLPVQFKRLRKEEERRGQCHKKKKNLWKERIKSPKEEKRHKKALKRSWAEEGKEKKQKKDVQRNNDQEEDFPRGCRLHSPKGSKKHHSSAFCPHSRKTKNGQELLDAAKKKKKKKRQRNKKDSSSTIDESLFLIKQRKKKSKQESSC
ncbi:zinc finger CCHC domain-containing protein 7 isoform X2 [Dermochelys coriacea]|uniref:zinc finger CCHC domain-containing protein 7 isoform X2 n=1 Tax=Dermochelys coriacea TaxID=27794 RepID=UPI001CA7D56D|nr:zinc finger CCHC domain-containing protein 7 isoform X2 [Dermochelys coriacea]